MPTAEELLMEGQEAIISACEDLLKGIAGWQEGAEEREIQKIKAGMEIDYSLCRERYNSKPKDI